MLARMRRPTGVRSAARPMKSSTQMLSVAARATGDTRSSATSAFAMLASTFSTYRRVVVATVDAGALPSVIGHLVQPPPPMHQLAILFAGTTLILGDRAKRLASIRARHGGEDLDGDAGALLHQVLRRDAGRHAGAVVE
jgi:hypothetical protein